MKVKEKSISGIVDDIRRIIQVAVEHSKTAEQETGLSTSQLWVIKILEESSPKKAADLAHLMYLHPATMVGLLDKLEWKGLIKRTRSEIDRRVVDIDLTEQGREMVKKAPGASLQSLLVKGFEALPEQKLSVISDSLSQVVNILGATGKPPKLIMTSETNLP